MTNSKKPAGKPGASNVPSARRARGRASSVAPVESAKVVETVAPKKAVGKQRTMGAFREMVYFAIRNRKLVIGLSIVCLFLLLAIIGPYVAHYGPLEYTNTLSHSPTLNHGHYLGTTPYGQDIFSQFVSGLRLAFIVGVLGGGIAAIIGMVVGFFAGFKAGITDEILSMLTNVVLCIPVFALLLVIAAFMKIKGVVPEALLIGFVNWPWAARALRSQTFSLTSREFVSLARLSGERSWKIIFKEIAPNMSSYLFMMFILLFGGAILTATTLDFIGLGPTSVVTLGRMMNDSAVVYPSLLLGLWWWFIPPGLAITFIVGGAYFMNVGLDEVFNPRLREM